MSKKNPFSKRRTIEDAYATYVSGAFTTKVLKTYQRPDLEAKNMNARWFVATSSPYTHGSYEYGDTYAHDTWGTLVEATDEWMEHYGKGKRNNV